MYQTQQVHAPSNEDLTITTVRPIQPAQNELMEPAYRLTNDLVKLI